MKTNPNDAVAGFPAKYQGSFQVTEESTGLTKRELFAAMAMQGMLSGRPITTNEIDYKYKMKIAIEIVDYLIEALNKENNK